MCKQCQKEQEPSSSLQERRRAYAGEAVLAALRGGQLISADLWNDAQWLAEKVHPK